MIHSLVAGQAPLPRQRGGALLPPSRSSSHPGSRQASLLQAVAWVVWGLQWWQTLKGPSLLLRSATSWAANVFPGRRKCRALVETSTVSRTLEVGRLVSSGSLCLFSALCPGCLSPGNTWEAYRSRTAPFTSRNRPTNSSSLTTLNSGAVRGYTGVPPVERSVAMQLCPYTVSTWQGKPCLLFQACRYSSGLSGDAYVACGDAASTWRYGVTAGSSG